MLLRLSLAGLLGVGVVLTGCDMPGTTNTDVQCARKQAGETQNAGASVHCPDNVFTVPPPPAEQKKGG